MRSVLKITILFTLTMAALVGLAPVSASAAVCPAEADIPFSDVADADPFCREILNASTEGWASGYPDGTFRPLNNITRQGAAAMISRTDYFLPAPACVVAPFTDVPVDHPFCPEIAQMKMYGIFEGWPDGTFRPGNNITRQAVAAIASTNLPTIGAACSEAPFTDVSVSHPLCEEITLAADAGAVQGYPDGTFRPTNPVTRQAFVAIVGMAIPQWLH